MRAFVFLLIVFYGILALTPFRWAPPEWTENGARIRQRGGIEFPTAGKAIVANSHGWLRQARREEGLEVRLRIRSLRSHQEGPARIFSISADQRIRNLTIGQQGPDLMVRLRTPRTTRNGTPAYRVENVFGAAEERAVRVVIGDNLVRIAIDDRLRVQDALPSRTLRNWDTYFPVVLGNELTGDRPWIGEIAQAEVRIGRTTVDCLEPETLYLPAGYWAGLHIQGWSYTRPQNLDYGLAIDALQNLVGFAPLGFCVAWIRRGRMPVGCAVIVCGAVSLAIECVQIGFDQRVPSGVDVTLNLLGGTVGALIAIRLNTRLLHKACNRE